MLEPTSEDFSGLDTALQVKIEPEEVIVKEEYSPVYFKDEAAIVKDECDLEELLIKTEFVDVEAKPCISDAAQNEENPPRARLRHAPTRNSTLSKLTSKLRNSLSQKKRKHTKTDDKLYACNFCDYSTMRRNTIIVHLKKHTEADLKCDECEYKTAYRKTLLAHVRSAHTGEKPYRCKQCDFSASTSENLRYHRLKVHSGEKPFKCVICNFSTIAKRNLRSHMETHIKDRPLFYCDICMSRFTRRSGLRRHLRATHEKEKRYSCSFCEYRCYRKSNLKEHVGNMHSEESEFK